MVVDKWKSPIFSAVWSNNFDIILSTLLYIYVLVLFYIKCSKKRHVFHHPTPLYCHPRPIMQCELKWWLVVKKAGSRTNELESLARLNYLLLFWNLLKHFYYICMIMMLILSNRKEIPGFHFLSCLLNTSTNDNSRGVEQRQEVLGNKKVPLYTCLLFLFLQMIPLT